jgi:hypothetical protein
MRLARKGSVVEHPSYPEGSTEIPLLAKAEDSGASRLYVGASHRLDKNEVRALVRFLERWLETGTLHAEKP